MKQELQAVLVQLLIAILPILSAFIIRLLNIKSNEIKQLTRNKLLDNYINYATDIIQKSVIAVNQIFVEKLKEQNPFTPEKQKEAFELAKQKILSMLNEDAKKILAAIYGDLNTFLDSQIEATVNNLKNQSIEKEDNEWQMTLQEAINHIDEIINHAECEELKNRRENENKTRYSKLC